MTPTRIRVVSPASLSNLGPGFDVLGLALNEPFDIVEAELKESPGVEIVEVTGDGGVLSLNATENVCAVAAEDALKRIAGGPPSSDSVPNKLRRGFGETQANVLKQLGVRLWLRKGIPIASGLGGSAASSTAGAFAVNELFGRPLSTAELVESALAGEKIAAGSAHGDNIVPSLLGGIVLIRSLAPLDVVNLPVPQHLHIAVVHPHCQISTAAARAILAGRTFGLGDIIPNTANLAAFIAALYQGDLPLLGRSVSDRLVEPLRAPMLPGFESVKAAAVECGALGCSISGSGPTVFAFADSNSSARAIAEAMRRAFAQSAKLGSDVFVGQVNTKGTHAP